MTFKIRQGANLPHWTKDNAVYAVTFRLADSMPKLRIEELLTRQNRFRGSLRLALLIKQI